MLKFDFLNIEDVVVRNEVLDKYFACDLSQCKGACCTFESEYGAPLEKHEITEIEKALGVVKEYLPREHFDVIDLEGFYEFKSGEALTKSYNNCACVFVYYQDGIAFCAIEKAYFENKISFRKPISCHLFPIRISRFGGDVLRFEKFKECDTAIENGHKQGIKLKNFCRESLIRKYGEDWYNKFIKAADK